MGKGTTDWAKKSIPSRIEPMVSVTESPCAGKNSVLQTENIQSLSAHAYPVSTKLTSCLHFSSAGNESPCPDSGTRAVVAPFHIPLCLCFTRKTCSKALASSDIYLLFPVSCICLHRRPARTSAERMLFRSSRVEHRRLCRSPLAFETAHRATRRSAAWPDQAAVAAAQSAEGA